MTRECTCYSSAQLGAVVAMSALMVACAAGDGSVASDGDELATVTMAAQGNGPPQCTGAARPKPLPAGVRRNVILMIGDGRQLEDEIAISRYLYGEDFALTWNSFPYQGYVATWDVTSYNAYARAPNPDEPLYDPATYDPIVGYDPAQAGDQPYPLENPPGLLDYLKTGAGSGAWPATDSASAATAMSTGTKTETGRIAWAPTVSGKARLKACHAMLWPLRAEHGVKPKIPNEGILLPISESILPRFH